MNKNSRVLFIDYLRGLAVIVMIEVHVVNAFLKTEIRNNWWFEIVNYINGLVAPSFLFITGFAFIIVLERKWDDYLKFNRVLIKQIQRIMQIWIIGYLLHLPYFSLKRILNDLTPSVMQNFLKVDVLHCIALSLAILLALVLILKQKKYVLYTLIIFSLILIFLSPLVWSLSFDFLPNFLRMYLNGNYGSLFPIFPWMGFTFTGAIFGFIYLDQKLNNDFFKKTINYSILIIVITFLIKYILMFLMPSASLKVSPNFFFQRAAIVVLLLGLFGFLESKNKLPSSFINLVGSESLIVYSIHLLIIFGMFFDNRSLSFIIGKTQDFSTTIIWSTLLIMLMILIAYLWHFIKKKNMLYARIIQYTTLSIAILIFIFRRY